MLDLSLDVKAGPGKQTLTKCLERCAFRWVLRVLDGIAHSAVRFTHKETLGPKQYSCEKCGDAFQVCVMNCLLFFVHRMLNGDAVLFSL
jgi:hypothetical protein